MKWLAMLMLTGCAFGEPVYHGDIGFTAVERASIEQGEEYVAHRVGQTPYGIVWDGVGDKHRIIKGGFASGDRDGYYHDTNIYISTTTTPKDLPEVAAHEFGHSWGLVHLPKGQIGIMSERVTELKWTEADQKMCEVAHVCL